MLWTTSVDMFPFHDCSLVGFIIVCASNVTILRIDIC